MKTIIILMLMLNIAYANLACFKSSYLAKKARKDIDFLVTNEDKIQLRNDCLKIQTPEHRVILFHKFLLRNYNVSLSNNSQYISKNECHITATRVTQKKSHLQNYDLNNKNVGARADLSKGTTTQVSKMTLMEGLNSQISYKGHSISISCFKRGNSWEISFQSNSKNLILNTSRQIPNGSEVELGSIITAQQSDGKILQTNSGIRFHKTNQIENEKLFLKVN